MTDDLKEQKNEDHNKEVDTSSTLADLSQDKNSHKNEESSVPTDSRNLSEIGNPPNEEKPKSPGVEQSSGAKIIQPSVDEKTDAPLQDASIEVASGNQSQDSTTSPEGVATPTSDAASLGTIMVVEDDMFISEIYEVKLSSAGYSIVVANNGREAVEKLEGGVKPDLILLDIVMPYMDGFDVLDAFSKEDAWKDIPVVLLTNLSQKEDIDRAMAAGAKDYLIKSHFTPTEVLSKVKKYIKK